MEQLVNKYANKLVTHGLCNQGDPLVFGIDAEVMCNVESRKKNELTELFKHLNINSIVFSRPVEPYFSIINYLASGVSIITPEDCETRTFLHNIPVIQDFDISQIVNALKSYKGVIIKDKGIVTYGTVTPEQAFITFSSICFSTYVKFFKDYYEKFKQNKVTEVETELLNNSLKLYNKDFIFNTKKEIKLMRGPLNSDEEVMSAMDEVGKLIVEYKLVDSFFGNLSYRYKDKIFISQTGSSLDEVTVDACPIDGSSSVAVTASSEYSAHRYIYLKTDTFAILHAHPKFCVIMSMICDKLDCKFKDACHIKCPEDRFIDDIPIVPGEVGTGPYGLCNTLPPNIIGKRGGIVYGHGLFTISNEENFIKTFSHMVDIEDMCMQKYIELVE